MPQEGHRSRTLSRRAEPRIGRRRDACFRAMLPGEFYYQKKVGVQYGAEKEVLASRQPTSTLAHAAKPLKMTCSRQPAG